MTKYYHSLQLSQKFNSVSAKFSYIFQITLFIILGLLTVSCEEEPTIIGKGLLPGSDFVNIKVIDTISAQSYTMYDDKIKSDNPAVSYLGQIYDPYFGTTTASFVSQIRLSPEWDGKPFVIDSVKLILHLLSTRGGTEGTHTLSMSEISEQIYSDSVYYSNTTVPLAGFEISDISLPALKPDTINDIELDIPVSFGNYLTRDVSKLFYNNNKPDFREFFKGLYFQLNSVSDPVMVALSLLNDGSGYYNNYFVLFMHDEAGTQKISYFLLDAKNINAAFNKFSHDFNTAEPDKRISHINESYRDTLTYMQYLNGVYTNIKFPGLESIKNNPDLKGIAVNKARLSIPVYFDGDDYKPSTVPPRLRMRYKTRSGTKFEVPDYLIGYSSDYDYSAFFDGSIDTIAKVYNFNIPTFVQGYLEDATDEILPELELYQRSGLTNVILKANHNKNPVKFNFTYTRF